MSTTKIQEQAEVMPNLDTVHLAICEIARLSHTHKHGQRILYLLERLIRASQSIENK